ncbi:ABC transporter permease [Pigmentiphaga litoralis]|uniref:DUF3526 domain-containing protein n=1 Tax=Pigmentiphaga litoralis TaxID=516702 RepID=UPI0016746DED|nr:DUF3526 domain-containing protein [Pigmentiphaga litoralis]GGX03228.1 ABC transporter permease [Pigmentiphaga litoralis]
MRVVVLIARDAWRHMLRDRVAVIGALLLLALTVIAAATSYERQRDATAQRERYQANVDQQFDAQPDRHPHRMVHYGQFVFRPLSPLAGFDSGIDAYTGTMIFLEGHRQNTANFGDARQSSSLLRFGQLTPAFVLQTLAPLLLVFLGFGLVARERASGTLRILITQGVSGRQVVAGKALALLGAAAVVLLPGALALAVLAFGNAQAMLSAGLLVAGYAGWLAVWALVIVAVSTVCALPRDALMVLLAVWVTVVILLPRLGAAWADARVPLATRFETDIAIARDLAAIGDSHRPDDPHFARFKADVLKRYGVTRLEDLPVNYRGLVGMEGERLTSALFDRYATASFERQAAQSATVDSLAWLAPTLAVRRLSMTLTQTDLPSYRRFVDQAEAYRYRLVQSLNQLQAEKVDYTSERKGAESMRIAQSHWESIPDFAFVAEDPQAVIARAGQPAIVLLAWLLVAVGALAPAARTLDRRAGASRFVRAPDATATPEAAS